MLEWSENMAAIFLRAKHALAAATLLVHLHATAPASTTVDASNIVIGVCVLWQLLDGQWRPLAFFSWQICPPHTRYSTFDRELLVLYRTILYFRYFWKV